MSGVYETSGPTGASRRVAMAAEQAHDEDCARLALCCLALLERHKADDKGRCQHCRTQRDWWRLRSRRCSAVPMESLYVEQPRTVVAAHRYY